MRGRSSRGHALALMLTITTAATVLTGITAAQLQRFAVARERDQARVQLLWLARSAARHGGATTTVPVLGGVRVERRRQGAIVRATAASAAGVATVTMTLEGDRITAWDEQYTAR